MGWGGVGWLRRGGAATQKNLKQPSLKAKPDGLQDEAGLIFAVVGVRWWYDEAFLRCAERHVTSCFTTTCLLYTSPPPARERERDGEGRRGCGGGGGERDRRGGESGGRREGGRGGGWGDCNNLYGIWDLDAPL